MYAPTAKGWLDGSDPSNNFRYRGKNFGKTILTGGFFSGINAPNPKMTTYHWNGTGRDSYIALDSGGMVPPKFYAEYK